MSEHSRQNAIRNALVDAGLFFRANVGQAWTGSRIDRLPGGRVLIHDARPFHAGLPPGFSDLFGLVPWTVTGADVGHVLGRFAAVEVKGPRGRPTDRQAAFLAAIERHGGLSGVARDVDEALAIIRQVSDGRAQE